MHERSSTWSEHTQERQCCARFGKEAPHCADGAGFVRDSDFQFAAEELALVAVAQYIGEAYAGTGCRVNLNACADTAQCVRRAQQCAGPGLIATLECCNPNHVCSSLFGSETFTCRSRRSVAAFGPANAEVLECPRP